MRPVVLYSHAPVEGGVLRHLEALARGLTERGREVLAVLNPGSGIDPFAARLAASGVRVERGVADGWRDLGRLAAWRRLLRRERPGLVHFHQCAAAENAAAILLAAVQAVPVVLTEHQPFDPQWPALSRRRLKRRLLRSARAVVLLGPSLVSGYRVATAIPADRIAVIPPFPDPVPPQPLRDGLKTVGYVGELCAGKGVDRLLDMAGELAGKGFRLRLFGRGPLGERARRVGRELAGALQVSWFEGGAEQALGSIDALLLLSRREGLPLVILEAVSAGVPVLTTRVGVVEDYFAEGEGVLYLDRADGAEVLEKLERLRPPEVRQELVAKGQARWRRDLTPPALIQRLIDLYERVGRP